MGLGMGYRHHTLLNRRSKSGEGLRGGIRGFGSNSWDSGDLLPKPLNQ